MVKSEDGKTEGSTPPSRGRLRSVGGSLNDKFNVFLACQALNTLLLESDDPHLHDEFVSITLALMAELAPRDALEGLLVSQIIATHNVAMKCHSEAMTRYQSTEKTRDYVNMGGKAVRSLTGLIDTLQRGRGKERQPVTVGRVNVSEGGQAIVGVVNERSAAPADRGPATNRGTIADEPSTPMRGAHPEPETVPIITGSGEDPLPDARRRGGQRGASRKQKRPQARPLHGGSDCDEAGITRADTQESTVDREQVSARDQILPTEDDCGKACEWSGALIEEQSGSPFFPRIELGWALQFIRDLYTRAKCEPVSIADAAAAWDLDPQCTATVESIDALLAYGFVEQSGQGSERRIRISELGWRVLEHPDQTVQHQGMAEAALKPALIAHYIEHWGAARPDEDVCISELKSEHGFTDKEAKQFIRVFAAASFFAREIEPYDPPDPLPEFARRRRGLDPAQNPWTKWLPDIEAFCNAE